MASRYKIGIEDLRTVALALQIGEGSADRFASNETINFIEAAEDWAEQCVSEFLGVPLKPSRAPGQAKIDFEVALQNGGEGITKRNFPVNFINAVIYRAVARMLMSNFFENAPNASESAAEAQKEADNSVAFLDMPTVKVGAGRRRNPNPFAPPMIAPRQPKQGGEG